MSLLQTALPATWVAAGGAHGPRAPFTKLLKSALTEFFFSLLLTEGKQSPIQAAEAVFSLCHNQNACHPLLGTPRASAGG